MELMTAGVTTREASVDDVTWHILGQTYVPKHRSESSMSWHATFPHGTFVPHHVHTTQDEFIYVLTGELELELDGGAPVKAGPGDLVRMPQDVPHGIFNRSGKDATCLFWVSPTANLRVRAAGAVGFFRRTGPDGRIAAGCGLCLHT